MSLIERAKGLGNHLQDLALAKLIERRITNKGGFIPDAAWLPSQEAFRLPYAEVLIVESRFGVVEAALVDRHDKHWEGWHIPGGRIADPKLNFEQACQRVAKAELGITDLRLLAPNPVHAYLWSDHPYGYPISLVGVAVTNQRLQGDGIRFFSEPPQNMVPHHADFFRRGLTFVAQNPQLFGN